MPNISSIYAGEVLDAFKVLLATGNETADRGLINVIPEIRDRTTIPRMKADNLIRPRVATPDNTTAEGSWDIDERLLQPSDIMVYHRFNPRNFEQFWKKWQPTGELVFRDLPPNVQVAFLEEVGKFTAGWMGRNVWQGDPALPNAIPYNNLMTGLITRALADADVIDVAAPVVISAGTVQASFASTYELVPAAVRNHPNFRFFCGDAAAEFYIDAVHAQTNKGNDFTQGAPLTYKGKTIERLVGFPDDTIFATHSSASRDSNIHMAVDWSESSMNALKIERVAADSEEFFIRADMKADTQISWGEECVLYRV